MDIDGDWVAAQLRACAERIILPGYQRVASARKPDGSIVTSADLDSQSFLQGQLAQRYPNIPLLGEEMSAAEQQQVLDSSNLLWCLDPLDGTSNFAAGVPVFGISLALMDAAGPLQAWIYDPMRQDLYTALRGAGAFLNGKALHVREAPALRATVGVVDYKRLTRELALRLLTQQPFHSQRNFGSCVLEWSWLAAGRYHFYLHGAQQLWDRAAGSLILTEAGGQMSTLDAALLPQRDLQKTSVLATLDPQLHIAWREYLAVEFPKSQA
ncbi:inositol monophosphatase [Acidithiobacillus sp. IBUN Pt1247-S3]|uniref:inositol monophosphatase family protein n=1 Tax=Acidithiobacillus sp. IBUN Pt1247-S3 TaxID=3166642 RepID=UPI0034E45EC0